MISDAEIETWMSSSHLNGGRNDEIESQRLKKAGDMRDFRDAATSLPRSPSVTVKIADEVRRYYIEDWIIELQLTRNGLTSVTRSSPPLEASSTLIRIVDMLRGVDPSRSHSDRVLSSRLLSKVDDASWILINIIRESFLVKRPQ